MDNDVSFARGGGAFQVRNGSKADGLLWVESGHFASYRDSAGGLNLSNIHSVERGLGCAAIIPAGWIGLAGLADGVGPQGWRGFAELIGWVALCVAAGLTVAGLLGRWREGSLRRYVSVLLAVAFVAAFTYAPHWLGLDAPMRAKVIFTTTLQVVGSVTATALILWVAWTLWSGIRRG